MADEVQGRPPGTTGPAGDEITELLPYSEPAAPPRAQRHGVVAALVVGIVGLLAAGVFALALATGDGGSSSPEDAVQAMLDAAAAEDVIGVLEALAPGERRALQGGVEDIAGELRRLRVLGDSFDLRGLRGVDLEFEGVEMTAEGLDDDLAMVGFTAGTVRTTTVPAEIPVGSLFEDLFGEFEEDPRDAEPETTVEDITGEDARIATIRDDGRWYVSLYYSFAENAREDAGLALPDFGNPVGAAGAADPEGAVEQLVRAALDVDVRRLIELTPPDEMAALHDYAPLFLDEAERAVADFRSDTSFELRLDRLDMATDLSGDEAVVAVDGFAVSGQVEGEEVDVSYDGECLRGTFAGETQEFCTGDVPEGAEMVPFPEGLRDQDFRVRVVQVDGQWYVSPTRTLLGGVVDVLRALEPEDVEQLVEAFQSFFFGAFMGVESSGSGYEEAVEFGEVGESVELAPAEPGSFEPYADCQVALDETMTAEEREAEVMRMERCLQAGKGSVEYGTEQSGGN